LLERFIRIKLAKSKRKVETQKKRLDFPKLKDPAIAQLFMQRVEKNLDTAPADVEWDVLAIILNKAAEETLGLKPINRKEWISDATWELIEKRKQLKNEISLSEP
jgi:hypothetical protein